MKVRKIIILGHDVSGFGGIETVCLDFIRLLRMQNQHIDISFVFFKKNNREVIANDDWLAGYRYHRISTKANVSNIRRLCFAYSLRKLILQENPDVIIALDAPSCYISNIARKGLRKHIVIFSWLHFSISNIYKNKYKKSIKYIKKADYYLSISSGITKQLVDVGIDKKCISTIFNPVSRYDTYIPTPEKEIKFIYVGRVMAGGQKNIQSLFNGLARVEGNWSLDIIGSGPDVEILSDLAKKLNINEKIHWHGWKSSPWEYIRDTLKDVTCLLLTSTFEGFVMALVEASAHGVYSISSDCDTGPADIIKEGVNGNLYPLDEPDKLVTLLQDIVDGKKLPEGRVIQHAIEEFYDDNYIKKVNEAFLSAGLTLNES